MPAPKRTTTTPKTRTLIVERAGKGKLRLTIPATCKVTYGTLQPGRGGFHHNDRDSGNVLRIYEGTKQTAVFQNVIEFRDEEYPIEVEVVEAFDEDAATVVDGKVRRRSGQSRRDVSWEKF